MTSDDANQDQLADTKDIVWATDTHHQTYILDLIVNNDVGLFNDMVLRSTNAYCSSSWAAFIVANRLFEQLVKLVSPKLNPREIGHRVKTRWWDEIDKEAPYDRVTEGLIDGLKGGFGWWNAMVQSPWADVGAMLDHVEMTHNAKEYVLLAPQRPGAAIHPLLPLALADAVSMLSGMLRYGKHGIRIADTTNGRIRNLIGRIFVKNAGVNLNIGLLNAITKEVGYLVLWSRIFNLLRESKYVASTRVRFEIKFRDGTNDVDKGERSSARHYDYHQQAVSALMDMFNGDEGLAAAHVDVAKVLANIRDWRLQFFIRISEVKVLGMVDRVLTDTTGSALRRQMDIAASWDV